MSARTVCVQLDASEDGTNNGVDRLFFILNGHYEPQWITLPQLGADRGWHRSIDTSLPMGEDFLEAGQEIEIDPADHYIVNSRSTVVLFAQHRDRNLTMHRRGLQLAMQKREQPRSVTGFLLKSL